MKSVDSSAIESVTGKTFADLNNNLLDGKLGWPDYVTDMAVAREKQKTLPSYFEKVYLFFSMAKGVRRDSELYSLTGTVLNCPDAPFSARNTDGSLILEPRDLVSKNLEVSKSVTGAASKIAKVLMTDDRKLKDASDKLQMFLKFRSFLSPLAGGEAGKADSVGGFLQKKESEVSGLLNSISDHLVETGSIEEGERASLEDALIVKNVCAVTLDEILQNGGV